MGKLLEDPVKSKAMKEALSMSKNTLADTLMYAEFADLSERDFKDICLFSEYDWMMFNECCEEEQQKEPVYILSEDAFDKRVKRSLLTYTLYKSMRKLQNVKEEFPVVKDTLLKHETLIFKRKVVVFVEQRLTLEELVKDKSKLGKFLDESDEKYNTRVLELWDFMSKKADKDGYVQCEDEEKDDDDDYYDCESNIEDIVDEFIEHKDITTCDRCFKKMEFKELIKNDEKWFCSKCNEY